MGAEAARLAHKGARNRRMSMHDSFSDDAQVHITPSPGSSALSVPLCPSQTIAPPRRSPKTMFVRTRPTKEISKSYSSLSFKQRQQQEETELSSSCPWDDGCSEVSVTVSLSPVSNTKSSKSLESNVATVTELVSPAAAATKQSPGSTSSPSSPIKNRRNALISRSMLQLSEARYAAAHSDEKEVYMRSLDSPNSMIGSLKQQEQQQKPSSQRSRPALLVNIDTERPNSKDSFTAIAKGQQQQQQQQREGDGSSSASQHQLQQSSEVYGGITAAHQQEMGGSNILMAAATAAVYLEEDETPLTSLLPPPRWLAKPSSGKKPQQQQRQQQPNLLTTSSSTSSSSSISAMTVDLPSLCDTPSAAAAAAVALRPRPPPGSSSSPQKTRPGVHLKHSQSAAVNPPPNTPTVAAAAAAAAAAAGPMPAAAAEMPCQGAAAVGSRRFTMEQLDERQLVYEARMAAGAAAAARGSRVALMCTPIAIAMHCPPDLQPDTWQPRDFVQTRQLYDGKICVVVEGYHASSGRPLALKVYNRTKLDVMERFQLAREVSLHLRCCHPYITALYAAYKDNQNIYLLMELAPRGNLYQMLMNMAIPKSGIRHLSEREAAVCVIRPIFSALNYLHEQHIIHRDIKLENVLLGDDGTIKLADFGLSIDTHNEPANTRLGTQGYFAPEVLTLPLKSSPFEGKSPAEAASRPSYDCKADIWSAGVVCFEILTGRAPFAADSSASVLRAILHRKLVYPSHLSPQAVSFLQAALTRDPVARASARQLLQHEFIRMHNPNMTI